MLDEIEEHAGSRDAAGIAAAISRLVADGTIPSGSRLPTVRAVAARLRVSPTTVADAWRWLVRQGVVDTRGRNGTFVLDARPSAAPRRFWRIASGAGRFAVDLSAGVPDPALLPDLGPALARAATVPLLTSYLDDPVLPTLERAVRDQWRDLFDPEAVSVVDGALDAIDRLLGVLVRVGDRVAVEVPGFPPVLDLLDAYGAQAVGVPLTPKGLDPLALDLVLADHRPAVLVLQPRAQNPTGVSTTPAHMRRLAAVLRKHPAVTVIEDDHSGDIASAPPVSMAEHLPGRVVHVKSFSKSHGPDLRLAVIGGPRDILDPLSARRHLGASWSSRILQGVLADLLVDPRSVLRVARSRAVYFERRERLVRALDDLGVTTTGTDGINVWMAVERERDALMILASEGIGVAPGSPFFLQADPPPHLRVTSGAVNGGGGELAAALARAARPGHDGGAPAP